MSKEENDMQIRKKYFTTLIKIKRQSIIPKEESKILSVRIIKMN